MKTREDVAERAGVSPATVSNVINGSKFVSPDLIAKVEKAIAELNYVPNRAARSLASRRTEQVGILVSSLSNPYYGNIAEGMEEVAREHGYIVSIINAAGPADQYISHIIERQMDGIFLTDYGFRFTGEQYTRMRLHGVRFAAIEGYMPAAERHPDIPCSRIWINYQNVMSRLFEFLKSMGHRRIAFLSGNSPDSSELRKSEYVRCMGQPGFEFDPGLIIHGTPPYVTLPEDGYRDMKKFLEHRRDFSAVFALNDLMALGAMKAIREAGLRIPEDISVIGCDNIYLAETAFPSLTSINIPRFEIGRIAMELLLETLREESYRDVTIEPELIIRESVARRMP